MRTRRASGKTKFNKLVAIMRSGSTKLWAGTNKFCQIQQITHTYSPHTHTHTCTEAHEYKRKSFKLPNQPTSCGKAPSRSWRQAAGIKRKQEKGEGREARRGRKTWQKRRLIFIQCRAYITFYLHSQRAPQSMQWNSPHAAAGESPFSFPLSLSVCVCVRRVDVYEQRTITYNNLCFVSVHVRVPWPAWAARAASSQITKEQSCSTKAAPPLCLPSLYLALYFLSFTASACSALQIGRPNIKLQHLQMQFRLDWLDWPGLVLVFMWKLRKIAKRLGKRYSVLTSSPTHTHIHRHRLLHAVHWSALRALRCTTQLVACQGRRLLQLDSTCR